jgi:hypothetical protein
MFVFLRIQGHAHPATPATMNITSTSTIHPIITITITGRLT